MTVRTVKTLLMIGAGPDQLPAIHLAKEMGLRVAAIDVNPAAVGASAADLFAAVSTSDRDGALAFAREVKADGVLTVISETGVPVVSFVGESLGLPAPSLRTARLATNKNDMRHAFMECGVPTIQSVQARNRSDAISAAKKWNLPLVVKPSDSSGQSGVSVVRRETDLENALAEALRYSTDGFAIVEQFAAGPEINVCAVVHRGRVHILSMSHRKTLPPPHFGIAYQHVYPLSLDGDTENRIRDASTSAVQAIGLTEGIAYPQLIVSRQGPVVIEIAARVPGGYMCELARLASGVDMLRVAILQAMGQPFELDSVKSDRQEKAVIVDFYTALSLHEESRVLQQLSGVERALRLPGVVKIEFHIKPGDRVPPLTSSRGRFGAIIVAGASPEEAADRLVEAKAAIHIR